MNIKQIIEAAENWVKNFIGKILPSSKEMLKIASAIVNFVKTFDGEHPEVLSSLVAIIPGKTDDYLLNKLRAALPTIVVKMKLAVDEANKTPDEVLSDAIKVIQYMDPEYKSTALGALWVHISNVLTDNGVSLKDLQKLQQVWYEEVGKVEGVEYDSHGCIIGREIWNGSKCVPDIG